MVVDKVVIFVCPLIFVARLYHSVRDHSILCFGVHRTGTINPGDDERSEMHSPLTNYRSSDIP
jgi:hypothetical protein